MIKVCIIEDDEVQAEQIKEKLEFLQSELENDKDANYNFSISSMECWNHAPSEFQTLYESIKPDILILDYQLVWGAEKEPWNGNRVLELIKNKYADNLPQVIVTSRPLFESNSIEGKSRLVDLLRRKPKTKTIIPVLIGKEYFTDVSMIGDLKDELFALFDEVQTKTPMIELKYCPYPTSDEYHSVTDFKADAIINVLDEQGKLIGEKDKYEFETAMFLQENIISILITKYYYLLIAKIENEIHFFLLKIEGQQNVKAIYKTFQKHRLDQMELVKGAIINTEYVTLTRKDGFKFTTHFSQSLKLQTSKLLKSKLSECYNKMPKHIENLSKSNLDEINPFAQKFERFFSETTINNLRRSQN